MLIKKPNDVSSAEITPKDVYLNRRQFILTTSATAVTAGAALTGFDLFRRFASGLCGRQTAGHQKERLQHQRKAELI
jgi:hypothetical protein